MIFKNKQKSWSQNSYFQMTTFIASNDVFLFKLSKSLFPFHHTRWSISTNLFYKCNFSCMFCEFISSSWKATGKISNKKREIKFFLISFYVGLDLLTDITNFISVVLFLANLNKCAKKWCNNDAIRWYVLSHCCLKAVH